MLDVEKKIVEGEKHKLEQKAENEKYPPCNVRWRKDEGTELWCTTKSGGVERSWVGFPRRYFSPLYRKRAFATPGGSHELEERCVCVKSIQEANSNPNMKVYPGCDPNASSCQKLQ